MKYLHPISRKINFCLLFLVCTICIFPSLSEAQVVDWTKRTVNKIFNDTSSSSKPKFLVYPVVGYTPETRIELGASALLVYYAKQDSKNRLSEISAFSFFTQERQYGLWLDHALYTHQDNYFFFGRARIQQFPLLYHGVGLDTPEEEIALVEGFSAVFRERVLRRLKGNLFAGIEIDLNHLSNVNFERKIEEEFALPAGSNGATNLGLGIGIVYDERHNVLNVRKGLFFETGFLRYSRVWGSQYHFTNYFLDTRYFIPTTEKQVLAFQYYANFSPDEGDNEVPFHQLPLLGGESLMRGYYLGRYRDNYLMAGQVEYRFLPFPFSKRFGGSLFASYGGIAPEIQELGLSNWLPAGGAGLRFLLFPNKDIYTRFDVAFTSEGPGFYFFIGEAF